LLHTPGLVILTIDAFSKVLFSSLEIHVNLNLGLILEEKVLFTPQTVTGRLYRSLTASLVNEPPPVWDDVVCSDNKPVSLSVAVVFVLGDLEDSSRVFGLGLKV